jgi:hypothetical protein
MISGTDLGSDAGERMRFFSDYGSIRFPDAGHNGFDVERPNRARIDDLAGNAFLFQFLGGL